MQSVQMFYDHTLGREGGGVTPGAAAVLPWKLTPTLSCLVNRPKIVPLHRQLAHLPVLPVLAIFYFVGWLLAIQFFFGILRKFISSILSEPKSSLFRQLVPFQVRWLNLFCRKIFSLQGKWELVKVGKITLQRFSDIIFPLVGKPKTGLNFMNHIFHTFTKFQKQKVFNKHSE